MDIIKKLRNVFEETINDGPDYNGPLKNMNCFRMQLLQRKGTIYEYNNVNISMYRFKYLNYDSILMLFAIPLLADMENPTSDKRHLNDRVMSIMRDCENTFITLDYRHLSRVSEDKMMYLVCIKIIEEDRKK